jgi:uncharacterized protein (TIGR02271 family)
MNDENLSAQNEPAEKNAAQPIIVPVVEEQVIINKKVIESARVRILKSVEKNAETVDIPLLHDEIIVERIQLNKYLHTAHPPVRYEGDTMILSVVKEVAVVEKRLVLVEEIKIVKKQLSETKKEEVVLRKEKIDIERIENNIETKNL